MQHIKSIIENVFYSQENKTITLSFEKSLNKDTKSIYEVMEQIKKVLNVAGVDNISFSPDSLKMTIVTKEDKLDEILKVANDFKADVIHNGFN
jgi:hypothetical protein